MVHSRSAGSRWALGCLLAPGAFALVASPGIAADTFRRLSAEEIRTRIVGRVITDQSHWSDRFNPDGTLKAVDLGVVKPGTWKLAGNEMCVVRKARLPVTECFEIWIRNDEIEYRRDGIVLTAGVLRNE